MQMLYLHMNSVRCKQMVPWHLWHVFVSSCPFAAWQSQRPQTPLLAEPTLPALFLERLRVISRDVVEARGEGPGYGLSHIY